ncbi:MAG: hypothetical protein A2X22_02825 [Bacteroidetes bacterium GWF2_49_14]|nr:MAG: hypothetical protein A2X22_02825 [Bacteroidetes bacterium GWF2_49_14]HBB93507.1 hypothetical protein [Bacteroidales bacterium]
MKNFTPKVLILAFATFISVNMYGQVVVDLTGVGNANILVDTLPDVPAGAVVLLKPGMTYLAGGYAFDKAVTLQSAEPNNLNLPKIDCTTNFNFGASATADSIIFKNLEFFGEYDSRYILNSNVAATIGELRFDGCTIHKLRGMIRMKDAGPGTLNKFTILNCAVDSIRDYGILTVDMNTWLCNEILIKNSTLSHMRAFITNKNNTNTVVIDGCTANQLPASGQRLFRWREAGQDNVLQGITIKNSIWGPGWDETNTGSTGYDGFDGLAATTWTFENIYATSDLIFGAGKDTIRGFLNAAYTAAAAALWKDPANENFNFMDAAFPGIGSAGDPRWSVSTATGGREWNISHAAFNALGDVAATKTVAGLTIYAAADKMVTVDANGKTLDDMTFTHRIKLAGTGAFDAANQPINRVLAIDIMGPSNITVMGMSSSSSADRVLNLAAGNKEAIIGEFPALGASISKGTYYWAGGPGKVYLYSPNSGVNLYYIKAEPVSSGINPLDLEKTYVNVYPNPADDKVYIEIDRPVWVGVYSVAGSLLKSKRIESKSDFIDVSDLQQGIYLIRSLNESLFVKKLIVR